MNDVLSNNKPFILNSMLMLQNFRLILSQPKSVLMVKNFEVR